MSEALRSRKITHTEARTAWMQLHDAVYWWRRDIDVDMVLDAYFEQQEKLEAASSRTAETTLTEAFQATERRLGRSVDVADFTLGWQEALKDARKKWIGDEVERMRDKVEQRDRLLDRFTANNIKLNQELEKLRAALSEARKET